MKNVAEDAVNIGYDIPRDEGEKFVETNVETLNGEDASEEISL